MHFSFETQGPNTYLVYQLLETDKIDTLSLGMISNNKINGVTPVIFTQQDNDKYFKYNISAKTSVKQFFTGQVNKKRLLGVFSSIASAFLSAEEYMIDASSFILNMEYMFADVSSCNATLICLPIINEEPTSIDMGLFFKNIIFSLQFDQGENCDYVTRIFNYLNSATLFSLIDFKKVIEELKRESLSKPAPPVQPKPTPPVFQPVQPQPVNTQPQGGFIAPNLQQKPSVPKMQVPNNPVSPVPEKKTTKKGFSLFGSKKEKTPKHAKNVLEIPQPVQTGFAIPGAPQQPIAQKPPAVATNVANQPQYPAQQKTVQPVVPQPTYQQNSISPATPALVHQNTANYGETTVLSGGNAGETTVLGKASATINNPHLIRQKNNEKINLSKPVFRIGKEKSYVDYFIGDNTAISRSHANLISRDGDYFVLDTNSTNHTFVNGAMLQGDTEVKITHGTKIRLANEEFEFKLY